MALIYGQLVKAALEVSASDLSGTITGLMSWNSTSGQMKVSDGTNVRAILRNDLKAIIGTNGTANNNIRFHRGASPVIQFLQGGDATAEGTLSVNLAQTSGRIENYINSALPAVGNAGRLAWVTDQTVMKVDTGSAWVPLGSGGGGGSLSWIESADAPLPDIEFDNQVYYYPPGVTNYLYALVRVPTSYVVGSPISMKVLFYSPSTSNNILFSSIATLIQKDADAIDDATDTRTSTNAAVTLSGAANKINTATLDLSSSTGTINSVAVAAGDLIKVKVFRGTDTDTADARFLPYAAEVTFNP